MREGPFQFGLINDRICEAVPDRVAIAQGDRHVTYAELGERSRRLANLFASKGLGCHGDPAALEPWESCQDHIAVYMMNRPEFMEAYLGAYKCRAAPFNVNYRYTPAEITYLLREGNAKAVVYEGKFAPVLAGVLEDLKADMKLLLQVDDGSGEALLPGALDFSSAVAEASGEPLDVPYSGSDILLLYTGGTTGFPKGIMWEQEELFLHALTGQLPDEPRPTNLDEVVQRAVEGSPPRSMICPPLMHGAGQWASLITFNQGGTAVYSPRPETLDAHAILEAAEREKVTMMQFTGDAFGIPIVEALRERSYDLSSLFIIASQAVALTPRIRQAIHELIPNAMVIESYGTSEGGFQGLRIGSASDGDIAEVSKFGAVNNTVILSEDKMRVLDPSETETIGWISRSGRLPRGYYGDPEKTKETFITIDGVRYCVLGDRAYYRADGTMQFLGREAVCINTGGEKVFGEEVEAVLKQHPQVRDAIVVGTPDDRFGQRVTAVVNVTDDVSDEDLDRHCRTVLAGYKVPRLIVRVPEVPRLENGKPHYDRAREMALARL